MRVLQWGSVKRVQRSERVRGRQASWLACLVVLAALLSFALPSAASAFPGILPWEESANTASELEHAPRGAKPLAQTPSTTEPYKVCHPARGKNVECYLVADPTVKTSSGYALAEGPAITPLTGGGVKGGWDPENLQKAYGILPTGGEGQTVAIVEAYGDPTAESDLAVYRKEYDKEKTLEPCEAHCFYKINQEGKEKEYPEAKSEEEKKEEAEWGTETSLDMDMVSAACPHCHILLVEAKHSEISDLAAAVEAAAKWEEPETKHKVTEISNSYGGPEDSPECEKNGCSKYLEAYNPAKIPVTVSAGDSGYDNGSWQAPSFPASSPSVIAAGGTNLATTEVGSRKFEEWVWGYSGSGCSLFYEKKPWQTDLGCGNKRTDNDVAAVAEGVSIYSTPEFKGWENVGGTSVDAPLIAGIEAHATKAVQEEKAEAFYNHTLYNVTSGSNALEVVFGHDWRCPGLTYLCKAVEGYNGPTGWGAPDGPLEKSAGYHVVVSPPAVSATTNSATLTGYVNPEGHESTTYHFEYGKTTSYGTSVPVPNGSVANGAVWRSVSQTLTKLERETTYHFRLVATSTSGGTIYSEDHTFTTQAWTAEKPVSSEKYSSFLYAVSCTAPTACMATGAREPMIERLSGTEWTTPTVQLPTGVTEGDMFGVSCSSSTFCAAVGDYYKESTLALADRWNGTEWINTTTPKAVYQRLFSASCTSSSFCMAVGEGISTAVADHWNGTEWVATTVPVPEKSHFSDLYGVSCTSSTFCVAVGDYKVVEGAEQGEFTLAVRWNGTEWTKMTTHNPGSRSVDELFGVSCSSSTACTAVGRYREGEIIVDTLAERWNGTEWSVQSTPSEDIEGDQSVLTSVSCYSSTHCVAVGEGGAYSSGVGGKDMSETWNGTEWGLNATRTLEELGSLSNFETTRLYGVSCVATPVACTAVGYQEFTPKEEGKPGTVTQAAGFALPNAETNAAGSITETGATLKATVNPEAKATSYYFEYGTTTSYGSKTAEASAGSGTSNVEESKVITGLTASTTYDYRVVASNSDGATDGSNHTFATTAKPVVETKKATGITETGATLNGAVNPKGAETKYYFEYGTKEKELTKTTAEASAGSGTASVEESKAITGLTASTTYYFRIVAKNGDGTTDGGELSFATVGWSLQSTPNPSGALVSEFSGAPFAGGTHVSCSSSTACTGVGFYTTSLGIPSTLAERWNGSEWSVQTTPNASGATESYLHGVSCPSSTSCTAVGHYKNSSGKNVTLAEHWNGTEWTIQTTPNPSGKEEAFLEDVSCSSSTACIAVGLSQDSGNSQGAALSERWNGAEWSIQAMPNPEAEHPLEETVVTEIRGMSCSSSTACTAVGWFHESAKGYKTLAERWNGTEWAVQTTPNPSEAKDPWLGAVSCTSSTACTAVGDYYNSAGSNVTLAEHWNGTEWSIQATPNPSGATVNLLGGVSCSSSTACIAVGYDKNSSGTYVTSAERWNGTEWLLQSTPNPSGASESELSGVSCSSATVCHAVGYYRNSSGTEVTLAELYE